MKTLILPTRKSNDVINISDVSDHNFILVYNNDEIIGVCLYDINIDEWYLQTEASNDNIRKCYDCLYELIYELQEEYNNLKILVK